MDCITKIRNSFIHHGRNSNRIYVMSLEINDLPDLLVELEELAKKKHYTKIIAKVPIIAKEYFEENGFIMEAAIPGFYAGKQECCFYAKYLENERKINLCQEQCDKVLEIAGGKKTIVQSPVLSDTYTFRRLAEKDIDKMIQLYQSVFKSYPFPIYDKKYLEETMKSNVSYFGIFDQEYLISASSIEAEEKYKNAELTDFATLKKYRGQGLALFLLAQMEQYMREMGFCIAYTIARSKSYSMNCTFAKMGYMYTGILVNNTQIGGQIESMNIWWKRIEEK
ncbi:putative beta-lysine N-acetyltransferase [Anaeromicropila populeti]|uniref:Putative beta-lysine N-acetyltransferase n=1 Tax=Anaeromicropila populeti TaxID=37658 RepID=A0A1I6K6X0_9FIRM|nr:putative beta-lysine N-acetyltransferase [Anaeromicropila populeti]SFR86957.1 putative beta-lysine N-acetyltransferase [Anaeromicropila populeti]